jgi:putative tricarboxylic transport membrane protein
MPVSFDIIIGGIGDALNLYTIAFVMLGVVTGYLVGAIPGLNGPMAIAIAVPMTFYLQPLAAIGMLIGIMKGSTAGGAVPAILLNTPGTPDAAITAIDGYPLAKKGKPYKALKMALYSSVTGDTMSDLVLFTVSAPIAMVALMLGPTDLAAIIFFSVCLIMCMIGDDPYKGMIAAGAGFLLAAVGLAPGEGTPRLTFGLLELEEGLSLVSVGMGVLVLGEVLSAMIAIRKSGRMATAPLPPSAGKEANRLTFKEYRYGFKTMLRSGAIGTAIGATPGIGSTLAALTGYTLAKRAAGPNDRFGEGELKGIAAAEAANSAVTGSNLIPLLTLGIPGNVAAAFLVGALTIHGVTPGPTLFQEQGRLIYALFATMVIANMSNLMLGRLGLQLLGLVARIPSSIVYPAVLLLCLTGAWISASEMTGCIVLVIFGILGYLMRLLKIPVITFVIAFVLGQMWELPLIQMMLLSDGQIIEMIQHPVAVIFVLTGLAMVITVTLKRRQEKHKRIDSA